jgi:GGDEF domain-containing protein
MRDLLAACIELDTLAVDAYALFAKVTRDAELAGVFRLMEADEREHLSWWSDVQDRLDEGASVPVGPSVQVTAYMRAIVTTTRSILSAEQRELTDDEMLSLASSLEFFALDPVFAELILASHPDKGRQRLAAYDGHIDRLLDAMVCRRSWALAPHIAMLSTSAGVVDEQKASELHDQVTGLPRRPVAEEAVYALCAETARAHEPISVALIDLRVGTLPSSDLELLERELLHMVSAMTSLLRFTDLLARVDTYRFMVVMPATSASVASATVSAVAHAVSSIAATAVGSIDAAGWATSAIVTIPPEQRCNVERVFSAVEGVLGEAEAAGDSQRTRELG